MRSSAFRTIALASALLGCRETTEPFASHDALPVDPTPRRLTWSIGDDRSPSWSAGSDSIYYSASRSDYDRAEGVLMSIHRRGGVARPLLPAQLGRALAPPLVEPTQVPTSAQLTFLELRLERSTACGGDTIACTHSSHLTSPRLGDVWAHEVPDANASTWQSRHRLRFAGSADPTLERIGGYTVFESTYTPAQYGWVTERALPSKPSIDPDARMLTADDVGVHLVLPDGRTSILATGDVANPDWSPDGQRIAFDRVERLDTIQDLCVILVESRRMPGTFDPSCFERRIFHLTTPPVVMLMRADGSDQSMLAAGSDPAWHPDGESLLYVTPAGIVRHVLASGAIALVPGTEDAREPVVSPDGAWLAFTRYDATTETRDLWVTSLEAEGAE